MASSTSLIVFYLTLTQEKRSTLSMLFQLLAFTEIYSVLGVPQFRVTMRESVSAVPRSCAVINCAFRIPEFTGNIQARWNKIDSRTSQLHALIQYDYRSNEGKFNYHSNYSNQRAQFIGNPAKGDCSLIIKNIKKSDAGTYKFSVNINSFIPISTQHNGYSQCLLSVLEKPRISGHGNLIAGQRARLNCSIVHGCPAAKVQLKWVTSDEEGIAGNDTEEVEIVSEGPGIQAVLNVLTFIPSAAQQGKSLGCAVLAHGVQNPAENIILEIKYQPKTEMACTNSFSVTKCTCRVEANPPARILWIVAGANCTELSPELDVITWETNGHVVQSSVTFPTANGMGNMISCSARNERGHHVSEYGLHSDVAEGHLYFTGYVVSHSHSRQFTNSCGVGKDFRIVYRTVGIVGAGLVFLMACLLTVKFRRKRRGRCATHFQTQDNSPVYSAVVHRRNFATDHLESCRLGSTQPTRNNENDEIIYAAINV